MIPQWAKQVGLNARQLRAAIEPHRHIGYVLEHLMEYAEHDSMFDVTFFNREPIIEVRLARGFVYELWGALACDASVAQIRDLLANVEFSNGTKVDADTIWTLVWIPRDLDTGNVDLSKGDDIVGVNGETLRQIIHETYRCRSRAEENFFVARWIAS